MGTSHHEIVETRIDVAELALGMHVVRLDRPWEETDFLLQGFVIRDASEIEALRLQCDFVFIEGRLEPQDAAPQARSPRPKRSSGFLGLFKRGSKASPPREEPARNVVPRRRVTYINKVDTGTEMRHWCLVQPFAFLNSLFPRAIFFQS